jgi:hypothetical protein
MAVSTLTLDNWTLLSPDLMLRRIAAANPHITWNPAAASDPYRMASEINAVYPGTIGTKQYLDPHQLQLAVMAAVNG